MSQLCRVDTEDPRHALQRVAVNAVGVHSGQFARHCFRIGHAFVVRSLIPQHDGKQHAHMMPVKVLHHLPHALHAAGQIAEHVELIAAVDADIGISVPDEHAVDSAIPLLKVLQITVDGVLPGLRVVEIAVVHHHLRLHKTRLRPQERGIVVGAVVEADADAALVAPVRDIA